jgi:uncharacterized protein (TIGR03086 family)
MINRDLDYRPSAPHRSLMVDLKPAGQGLIDLLAGIGNHQLADGTPCPEYTVGDMIDHVDAASLSFTALTGASVDGQTDPAREPSAANLGADWRDTVARHVWALAVAWDDPAAWEGTAGASGVDLYLSNETWGKIALTELVVHGWDLATATGQVLDLPEPTLRACLEHVADYVPNAPIPELWGYDVDVDVNAPLLDQIVAITGRNPVMPL